MVLSDSVNVYRQWYTAYQRIQTVVQTKMCTLSVLPLFLYCTVKYTTDMHMHHTRCHEECTRPGNLVVISSGMLSHKPAALPNARPMHM